MEERERFYRRVVGQLLEQGLLRRDLRVLVVAGSDLDRRVFGGHGFADLTVSNLDPGDAEEYQDAESLTYPDGSFDLAVISAALHHCRSPHRALLELYRVARLGVLGLESRDSALMRLAIRLGVVDEYELTAVASNDFGRGGLRNGPVPNYVYRWTEREIVKTIASAAPERRHRYVWFRELELPVSVLELSGKRRWRLAARPLRLVTKLVPGQANLFAFAVFKEGLQPWMRTETEPDEAEIGRRLRR
jgi:SAM-dependent methyltransferase